MITSVHNPHIRRARKLQKRGLRDKAGLFLVEGTRGITEAFASERRVQTLFVAPSAGDRVGQVVRLAKQHSTPVFEVSDQVMRSISDATTPPGAIAVAHYVDVDPVRLLERGISLAVVLAGVRDPGNLGTILRTAWAAGAEAVFLGSETVDVYNPKVVRAAAGALFNLSLARDVELVWLLTELKGRGVRLVAADPRAPTSYDELDLSVDCALVFGGESGGVPQAVASEVDVVASIPMPGGAESLNVAVAAALFLFEAASQRRTR